MLRALVICALVALASPAAAQDAPAPPTAPATAPRGPLLERGISLDPHDSLAEELEDEPRTVRRPSGFWTGYRPARGGAYKWPLLAIGVAVCALTAVLVVRSLRRASRAPRPRFPAPPATS